jgi:predicted ArsR family transcriptional regulator
MSDKGREQFEHSYDDLAVSALRFISTQGGDHLVAGFAKQRADEISKKAEVEIGPAKERARALAKFLTKEGYAASTHSHGIGVELCQHHCPIAHVAAEFPQLCEEETKAFAQILGTHVQRLATIADGDGVCTTFIPQLQLQSNGQKKGLIGRDLTGRGAKSKKSNVKKSNIKKFNVKKSERTGSK